MRLPPNLKVDLSVAASRPPGRPAARPTTDAGSLAALREQLQHGESSKEGGSARGNDKSRGHDAKSPSEIPARGWWDIAKRVFTQFGEHRIMTEAAGVTFYALLALFPALAALVSLFGLVANPQIVADQLNSASGFVPGGGIDILHDQIKQLTSASGGALSFAAIGGLLFALWSANGGTKSIFDALNVVYDEKEKRGFVRRTLVSLALTVSMLVFIILAMAAVVALPIALKFVGLSAVSEILIRVARWPVLMVIISLLLAVLYRYGPSRTKARWRWVTWGGALAAVIWVIVSIAFSYYVSNFGNYNKTYGSLGAAIGFLTWIWISSMVVLIGAEVDAEMEHQTGHDTTTGPAKPRGARGANKADQVAAA